MLRKLATVTAMVFALSLAAQARAQELALRRTPVSERATVQHLEGLKQIFEKDGPAIEQALKNEDFRTAAALYRETAAKIKNLSDNGVYPDIRRCSLKTALLLERGARIFDELGELADLGNAFVGILCRIARRTHWGTCLPAYGCARPSQAGPATPSGLPPVAARRGGTPGGMARCAAKRGQALPWRFASRWQLASGPPIQFRLTQLG